MLLVLLHPIRLQCFRVQTLQIQNPEPIPKEQNLRRTWTRPRVPQA